MFALVFVHVTVTFPLHRQLGQQINQIIVGMRPCFPFGCLPAVIPSLERNLPYEL